MSKIKPNQAVAKKILSGFGGIRCDTARDGKAATDMRNFRIRCDGSLEKREGWGPWRNFSANVRGFWQGTLGDGFQTFVVAGTTILRLYGSVSQQVVGTTSSTYGRICFFKYEETLYLLDGKAIYYYLAESQMFFEVAPYAPLLGHNWHPVNHGEISEPINLLTNRVRIHYLNSTSTSTFFLPFFAKSVDRVRLDNTYTNDYTITSIGNAVEIPGAEHAGIVEIAFTMDYDAPLLSALMECTQAYVDSSDGIETALLFGESAGYRLFVSCPVSTAMINYCKVVYPMTTGLYFKESNLFHIGSSDYPIRAVCKQHDRLLVFNAHGAWSLKSEKKNNTWESHPVLHGFGCNKAQGVTVFQNDVLLLDNSGLYQLHSSPAHEDDFSFKRLSAPLCEKLIPFYLSQAEIFLATQNNEIWLRSPSDVTGLVWVRNNDTEEWFCFDNIPASFFFETQDGVGFASGKTLYLFDTLLTTDNGAPFSAYYQSDYLCIDHPEQITRALRTCLCCQTNGNTVKLTLETEQNAVELSFSGEEGSAPEIMDRRVALGRFRFLRFRISVSGDKSSRFYSLSLYGKP